MPQKRLLEALKAEMDRMPELSRLMELQGRSVEALRAQELGERLQEVQRAADTQSRALEAMKC